MKGYHGLKSHSRKGFGYYVSSEHRQKEVKENEYFLALYKRILSLDCDLPEGKDSQSVEECAVRSEKNAKAFGITREQAAELFSAFICDVYSTTPAWLLGAVVSSDYYSHACKTRDSLVASFGETIYSRNEYRSSLKLCSSRLYRARRALSSDDFSLS